MSKAKVNQLYYSCSEGGKRDRLKSIQWVFLEYKSYPALTTQHLCVYFRTCTPEFINISENEPFRCSRPRENRRYNYQIYSHLKMHIDSHESTCTSGRSSSNIVAYQLMRQEHSSASGRGAQLGVSVRSTLHRKAVDSTPSPPPQTRVYSYPRDTNRESSCQRHTLK